MHELKFPAGFLWGSATAAHQVEGNNKNSDWWRWEEALAGKPGGPVDKSGIACDSYNRYQEDFDLAKELKQNCHRLSIEWSRIEPTEGKFDAEEIEHYRQVLMALKARKLKTFVTLWHVTLPTWLADKGGWCNTESRKYFARYAELIARELGSDIDFFLTINEPIIYVLRRYGARDWFPHLKSGPFDLIKCWIGLIRAHRAAYDAVKSINRNYQVGFVEAYMSWVLKRQNLVYKFAGFLRELLQERLALYFLAGHTDFIGINYYFHDVFSLKELIFQGQWAERTGDVNDWGFTIYPAGIYSVVKKIAGYGKPIYITENGLADGRDAKRERFIVSHLYYLHKAIAEGIDIRSYIHWTLLDNFEWSEGYALKFGLIAVDRADNLKRVIRPSALAFAQICAENKIPQELFAKHLS